MNTRSIEQRAIALMESVEGFANNTAETGGDSGDNGDTAAHKALDSPHDSATGGDSGDKETGARFELLKKRMHGRASGVYWIGTTQDKATGAVTELPPAWICSPLTVAAQTRDPQSSEWGRLLQFPDNAGRPHSWAMPMRMLAGSGEELRSQLLSEGLIITSNPADRRRVGDYVGRSNPVVMAQCVTRTGWHGDVFAMPRETFGDTEAEPVIFQTSAPDGVALGQAGTLAQWREAVAEPCAGNSRLVLALSCAFAGPCIGLLSAEGGGVHLKGASSIGKTTSVTVAASVYGPPAFVRTWRQTDNALEGVASLHSDMLLVLDEMGQLDPKHAGAVAYMLANGQGKGRSHRDGSPRALSTWRVLFLSTGEIGLSDLVMQGGGKVRAGQEVRVIDLSADAGKGAGMFDSVPDGMSAGAFADSLKRASATHYGTALPAFLRKLVVNPDKARNVLREMRESLAHNLAGDDAGGQVRRVADRLALIAAAGELATVYKLTGWKTGEAEDAIRKCFASWLAGRGTKGAAEPAAMLSQVRAFLEAHGESRFTAWDACVAGPKTINRAGFRKQTEEGPEYYVEREVFHRELAQGFDHAHVARVLADTGALIVGGDGRHSTKVRLPDGRNTRVYRIGPTLWRDS